MKKPVTKERVFCDFCQQGAQVKCLVCGRDLCSRHMLHLSVTGPGSHGSFYAYLCPEDGKSLLPILKGYRGRSAWEKCSQSAEFNEARLNELIGLLEG